MNEESKIIELPRDEKSFRMLIEDELEDGWKLSATVPCSTTLFGGVVAMAGVFYREKPKSGISHDRNIWDLEGFSPKPKCSDETTEKLDELHDPNDGNLMYLLAITKAHAAFLLVLRKAYPDAKTLSEAVAACKESKKDPFLLEGINTWEASVTCQQNRIMNCLMKIDAYELKIWK